MKKCFINILKNYPGILVFIIVYGISLLLVGIPNEPIADSWAYGKIVKNFLETGSIRLIGWGAMNLVFHIFWGALFCFLKGGFSFAALNFSTLALSVSGSIAFYLILKDLGFTEPLATLAGCILIVNPIFFACSFSYMTDVPFICWALLSILFYLRSFNEKGYRFVFLGSIFGIFAFLIRQNGIFVILAANIFYFSSVDMRKRLDPLRILALVALPAFCALGFSWWYQAQPNVQKLHLFLREPSDMLFVLLYLGLFCLPVITAYAVKSKKFYMDAYKDNQGFFRAAYGIMLFTVVYFYFKKQMFMPYLPAWITEYGVLGEYLIFAGSRDLIFSPVVWLAITFVAFIATTFLLASILVKARSALNFFAGLDFMPQAARRFIFPLGILSALSAAVLLAAKGWLFKLYAGYYNHLYQVGYVKKTFAQNYHKIASIHGNLLVWSVVTAVISFVFILNIKKTADPGHNMKEADSPAVKLSSPFFFIYLFTFMQALVLILMKDLCDRYLLILVPGTVIFILRYFRNFDFSKTAVICGLAIFFIYSALVTSDIYASNEAGWKAGNRLLSQGISREKIDGGFAWNGWNFNKPISTDPSRIKPRSKSVNMWYLSGIFSEIDDQYVVSYSNIRGYARVSKIKYRSLLTILTNRNKFIYALKRLE